MINVRNKILWILIAACGLLAFSVAVFQSTNNRESESVAADLQNRGEASLKSASKLEARTADGQSRTTTNSAVALDSDTDSEPAAATKDAFAEFWKAIDGRPLLAEELLDPSIIRGEGWTISTLKIIVRRVGLTAAELRAAYDQCRDDPDSGKIDPMRKWLILGTAYARGKQKGDLEWLVQLASAPSESGSAEQIAAIRAAKVASGFNELDAAGAMSEIAGTLLDNAVDETGRVTMDPVLELALDSVEELGGGISVRRLEELASQRETPLAVSGKCFEVLARSGGYEGAEAVISAFINGVPGAIEGVKRLHDESAVPVLVDWIDRAKSEGGDRELGQAALTGLLSTGSDLGLGELKGAILGKDVLDPTIKARTREMALGALQDLDDPRSYGLVMTIFDFARSLREGNEATEESTKLAYQIQAAASSALKRRPVTWMLPSQKTTAEVAEGIRRAIETLPPNSAQISSLWSTLKLLGRPEDVPYITANAPR